MKKEALINERKNSAILLITVAFVTHFSISCSRAGASGMASTVLAIPVFEEKNGVTGIFSYVHVAFSL